MIHVSDDSETKVISIDSKARRLPLVGLFSMFFLNEDVEEDHTVDSTFTSSKVPRASAASILLTL